MGEARIKFDPPSEPCFTLVIPDVYSFGGVKQELELRLTKDAAIHLHEVLGKGLFVMGWKIA